MVRSPAGASRTITEKEARRPSRRRFAPPQDDPLVLLRIPYATFGGRGGGASLIVVRS